VPEADQAVPSASGLCFGQPKPAGRAGGREEEGVAWPSDVSPVSAATKPHPARGGGDHERVEGRCDALAYEPAQAPHRFAIPLPSLNAFRV